ncbi:MAG: hypothetical protein AVDCRST_MAG51-1344 [uncultured Ramlibacter sp.]|uniref:Activator of Hsp90 ATPase homologue 1/2-like C-terminal domain-containing protein n=1 Tax=uncultured Ramlibacter sp. TaxID=260755 RepID=A0A6J4PB65_9BURK|nr:MAG: hypothetical protein AVDCRST_MAG51-1344 [uncultured Ramlibacter sp.]
MKKTLQFTTLIHAPRSRVWDTMLEPASYRDWTAAFTEGSYYEGGWGQGEAIRFRGPDGNGMVAVIAENRRHEFISIEHRGFIQNGVEDTQSEAVRAMFPAYENYRFSDEGGGTRLDISMDVTPDFEEMMNRLWPAALARLKALCERSG